MENLDPKVVAALISAIVSIIVVLLSIMLKSIYEKHFHLFKLESEYKYEQRKKIKQILSENKIHLINSAEVLNHRFWNFSGNYGEKWHCIENKLKKFKENHYMFSFVYRMISFFAWQRKINKEMVFLDTTIASEKDLELIKFLKLFQQIMCDIKLFKGLDYDKNVARDHFFNNPFEKMIEGFLYEDKVVCYTKFGEEISEYYKTVNPMIDFINGISPTEKRFRWDKIQILHLTVVAFLNSYGYDFQYTSDEKLEKLKQLYNTNKLINNFKILVSDFHLEEQKEIKRILKLFKYA